MPGLWRRCSATRKFVRCGWPSFFDPKSSDAVTLRPDHSLGMTRTEGAVRELRRPPGPRVRRRGVSASRQRYCIAPFRCPSVPGSVWRRVTFTERPLRFRCKASVSVRVSPARVACTSTGQGMYAAARVDDFHRDVCSEGVKRSGVSRQRSAGPMQRHPRVRTTPSAAVIGTFRVGDRLQPTRAERQARW